MHIKCFNFFHYTGCCRRGLDALHHQFYFVLTHTHLSLMHYVQSITIKPTFLWYYLLYLPNGETVFSVKHICDRLCYLMVPFPVWKTTKSFPYPPHLLLFPPHYANHNTWMEKRVSVRKTKKHCILQNIYGRAANWLIHY